MSEATTSARGSRASRLAEDFPPHVLREYALVADGERGALVGPRGDIAWMCAPRWHDDAVFSSLIGGAGLYAVTPDGERFVWGGYYEEGTLIWRSRWVTASAVVECREALACPARPGTAIVLRRVHACRGQVRMRVVLDPRAGYGKHALRSLRLNDGLWTGRSGQLHVRWAGAEHARTTGRGGPLVLLLDLDAGATHDLVLEVSTHALEGTPPDAAAAWEATEAAWSHMVPDLNPVVGGRDARHAYAVLCGLTSSSGAMVAAATTSLPERADEDRNYDYRYAWIRDQCYAGQAAAVHKPTQLLDSAVRFVSERLLSDGPQLRPAYCVDGSPVPDERHLAQLTGYPGGTDKVGNWVNKQWQLDALGEALLLLAAAARHDRLDAELWQAAETAVSAIEARWAEPDAGIWELDNHRWAHSRLTCVAGLRAIAGFAGGPQSARWASLADAVLADVASDCRHPSGRWQRAPDDQRVDAALLLPVLRGALPPDDPRSLATLAAVRTDLERDGYVYRFRHDPRPLHEAEGAFLLCGFVMSLASWQLGDARRAVSLFQRNRASCGPPGLLTEEFDVLQRQLRGNLPQAFVHALLLECACRLATDPPGGLPAASQGTGALAPTVLPPHSSSAPGTQEPDGAHEQPG